MKKMLLGVFLTFACIATNAVQANTPQLEVPPVLLTDLAVPITISEPGSQQLSLFIDGELVFEGFPSDGQTLVEIEQQKYGSATIELRDSTAVLQQVEVPVIPAWASLLPPVIAITLAFLLRAVIPALFAGIIAGAWAVNGLTLQGGVKALFDSMAVYMLDALSDPGHAAIIIFTMTIGGMVGVVSRNGGMLGIVNRALTIAKTPRKGQAVIAFLGLTIFFDDYSNTLIVGNATRPMSDHLKISREKLAYLVDSTAAPVASIAIITTWVGFQVGLINESIVGIEGITQPAYTLFLHSIPYSFYPFLALLLVFTVVASKRDFGAMLKAERRARETGQVSRPHGKSTASREIDEMSEKEGVTCRAINGVVPIVTLVVTVIVGLYIDGEGDSLQDIVGSADSYRVLIWASFLSSLVAVILTLSQGLLSLEETVDAWVVGAKFMITGLIVLLMAWAIADVSNNLQTANFLISILGDGLSPYFLPTAVFLLAAVTGFATGSSWAVMGILMPLVIPLCWAVMQANGIADADHMHILYSCLACVLTGAVWSDHCSPISDTTVLSSLATGCNHMDHVTTQLPYASLSGVIALVVCTLPVGYGMPWWLMLGAGGALLGTTYWFVSKPVEVV
ncbi:MAG: Na+/H+ antiporter NhaC family protein [Halioglobus sp.]|nr:Na+/H+ antiporter NhaC family protein [Halioglobus sp.]MDG2327588.1 Na+/H+ antiporter NhaC family protein [Halioglobus sp.]